MSLDRTDLTSGEKPMNRLPCVLAVVLMFVWVASPPAVWADPNLADKENYAEGIKLHQQGKYKDAYEFYFKDMTQTPKTVEWLKNYREQYLSPDALNQTPGEKASDPNPLVQGSASEGTTAPPRASASTSKGSYVYVNTGMSSPLTPEEFNDFWKSNVSIGCGFGLGLTKITVLVFDINYNSFPFNENAYARTFGTASDDIRASGGAVNNFLGTLNAKFKLSSRDPSVNGYGIVGLGIGSIGFGNVTVMRGNELIGILLGTTETKAAMRFGLGLEIKINPKTKFYLETNGVSVFTQGDATNYNMLKGGFQFRVK